MVVHCKLTDSFSLPETTLKWFMTVLPCISVHFTYSFTIFPAPSLILSVLTCSNESVNHYHPPSDPKTDLLQESLLWSIHQSGSCLHGCLWDQYALFRTSCLSTCLFLPVSVYEDKKWGLYDFDKLALIILTKGLLWVFIMINITVNTKHQLLMDRYVNELQCMFLLCILQ